MKTLPLSDQTSPTLTGPVRRVAQGVWLAWMARILVNVAVSMRASVPDMTTTPTTIFNLMDVTLLPPRLMAISILVSVGLLYLVVASLIMWLPSFGVFVQALG